MTENKKIVEKKWTGVAIEKAFTSIQRAFTDKFSSGQCSRTFFREFAEVGLENAINKKFYSWSSFQKKYFKKYPTKDVTEKTRYDIKGTTKVKVKDQSKKYFITALVSGQEVDESFMDSVELYCKEENAELVLLVMRGVSKSDTIPNKVYDKYTDNMTTEFIFNKNIRALDFCLAPQQILSLTGLDRYGQKDYSLIVAHTKQYLNSVPARGSHPHLVLSTGCCTRPNYSFDRVGRIATQDHLVGGLVVDTKDPKSFHVRQIQSDKQGGFHDIVGKGRYYLGSKSKSTESSPIAIALGDIHLGEECALSMKASREQIKELHIPNVYFHDLNDFNSVSHHDRDNLFAKVGRKPHQQTLEKELEYGSKILEKWLLPNVNYKVVRSNHDDFLNNYLSDGVFIEDHHNAIFSSRLLTERLEGLNPVEEYYRRKGLLGKFKLEFLDYTDSCKHAGIEHALHGHKGNNGARGSARSLETSLYNANIGHSHSPCIWRTIYQSGTNSVFNPAYTMGSVGAWVHANTITFKNGNRQLVININGKWR